MRFPNQRVFGPTPNYPRVREYREPDSFTIIAGPCSIETYEQTTKCAEAVLDIYSATAAEVYMRGGVFRAGTYPPESFGLNYANLKMWKGVCRTNGIKNIVEVIDIRDIEKIDQFADAFQVGARQSQGYALLNEIAKTDKPVFIKNGAGMKLDEILGAVEYLARGRCKPRIIIRGSSSFHNHVRWDMSVSLIPAIKTLTGVPVIADPSHGTGRRDLVRPMGMAGVAAGADGILVEMHPDPDRSVSDSEQAITLEDGKALCLDASKVAGWTKYDKEKE